MVKRKNKSKDNPVFEIFVVLAIVAIVAITGQVLANYENSGVLPGRGSNAITGFVISDFEEESIENDFLDLGVTSISVNPPSPIIGMPFKVKVTVANQGFEEIDTPFYVKVEITPNGKNVKPTVINSAITRTLAPGEEASAVISIALVTKEGPMKIIATADSTGKLDDENPSNNQRSKTVIITAE